MKRASPETRSGAMFDLAPPGNGGTVAVGEGKEKAPPMTGVSITERTAGAALIIAALGTMIAMAHHPSGAHPGARGGIVHGAMIVLLMLLSWGFLIFTLGRGIARPLILGGIIAYAVSMFAHIGAATINGFVVPALADPQGPPVSHDIFRLTWNANQALANLGVYMTGLAYLLWSLDLLSERARPARFTGILGLVAGILPAALLASGLIRMNVVGAFVAYALHAGWAALVGLMVLRGVLRQRASHVQTWRERASSCDRSSTLGVS